MTTKSIQQDVVEGCIRIILYVAEQRKTGIKRGFLNNLYRIGTQHITSSPPDDKHLGAAEFIMDFIKLGIAGMDPDDINKIANGDYSRLWKETNAYMSRFGYEPVEPVPITLSGQQ